MRALEEGQLDLAIARFEQIGAIDPAYQDSAALLEVARAAQLRTRTEARQQLEQVRQRRRSTMQEQAAPPPAADIPVLAAASQPQAPVPAPTAGQSLWARQRVPLIIGAVLLLLALLVLALIPSLLARPDTGVAPTQAPRATAANILEPTAASVPTALAPTAASVPTALAPLPEPAGTLAYEDDFSAGAQKSGLVGTQLAPDLTVAVDPAGVYTMSLAKPDQAGWVFLPRLAAGDFSAQIDLADGSADFTGAAAQGLVFRGRDSDHFYALLIDPRKGEYNLRKRDGKDTWVDLIAAKPSPLIQQKDALNQLRLDAAGDAFTLYLNGQKLDSAKDDAYTFGMVGTIIANADAASSTMRFDNLKIWSNDPPPRASTLPATRQSLSGDMVLIHGGEFVMGSNDNPNDLPHIVSQPDFYIDSKEVTNLAYLSCADVSGCSLPDSVELGYSERLYHRAGVQLLSGARCYLAAGELLLRAGRKAPADRSRVGEGRQLECGQPHQVDLAFWRSVRRGKAELG